MEELYRKLKEFLGFNCSCNGNKVTIKKGDNTSYAYVRNDEYAHLFIPNIINAYVQDGVLYTGLLPNSSLNKTDYAIDIACGNDIKIVFISESLDESKSAKNTISRILQVSDDSFRASYDEGLSGACIFIKSIGNNKYKVTLNCEHGNIEGVQSEILSENELINRINESDSLKKLILDNLYLINSVLPDLYKKIISSYNIANVFINRLDRFISNNSNNYILRIAPSCPVDVIRPYVEKIRYSMEECATSGEIFSYVPNEIVVSPECINFWSDGHIDNKIGQIKEDDNKKFGIYWPADDKYPALNVDIEKRDDGLFHVTYIKEDASDDTSEFVWRENRMKKFGSVFTVVKDMDEVFSMFPYSPSTSEKTKKKSLS